MELVIPWNSEVKTKRERVVDNVSGLVIPWNSEVKTKRERVVDNVSGLVIPWNSEVKTKRERVVDNVSGLTRMPFPKRAFYGAKEDPRWKARLLALTAPKDPYKVFYKQARAFEWIDRTPIPERFALHVFAEEYECFPNGQKERPLLATALQSSPVLVAKSLAPARPMVPPEKDGHLELLQWLEENGYPWNEEAYQEAPGVEELWDKDLLKTSTSEGSQDVETYHGEATLRTLVRDSTPPSSLGLYAKLQVGEPTTTPPFHGSARPSSLPVVRSGMLPHRDLAFTASLDHPRALTPTSPQDDLDVTPTQPAPSNLQFRRGSRRYIVSTYDEFWRRYVTVDLTDRHFYEVIREGEPSRLYFDIEFDKNLNPWSNGDKMVETFIRCVSGRLSEKHGLCVWRSSFLDLESEYVKKFSRHVICPAAVFRDNIHCGLFVESLVEHLSEKRESDALVNDLWIKTEKGVQIFIDMGVYTKNRNFRLPFSSKLAKGVPLALSNMNQYVVRNDKDVYNAALVCNCEDRTCLLECKEVTTLAGLGPTPKTMQTLGPKGRSAVGIRPEEGSASRWPDIDAFVSSLIRPGYIRKCLYFADRALLIYEILGNRYCANVGRWHKSNHIMICVDLAKGVCYQKCHDPDCRGFRSEENVLPAAVGMAVTLNSSA